MPICIDCKKEKHTKSYYRRPDNKRLLRRCKDCHRIVIQKYREETPNYSRERSLRKYGITLTDYSRMFLEQQGSCAMCRRRSERQLCVDHDHMTNKVRALLCNSCNALIGFAQEDVQLLKSAIEYIMKYNIAYQKSSLK